MITLAIESSCDETSIAVLENMNVKVNLISTQYFHSKYGGVVPELASRAHLKTIALLYKDALASSSLNESDIDLIAVTQSPGLIGSLLVGLNFAKGLSIKLKKPLIPVNHIEGHIFSSIIENQNFNFPFICLVVSGGHTLIYKVESFFDYEILGSTIDDAAGEAFDKTAKLMGLPYPGGPELDKLAQFGNPKFHNFPRSMINSGDLNFSFSGLKTSVRYFIAKNYPNGIPENIKQDLASSIQSAIVEILVIKTMKAAQLNNINKIAVVGGVSANSLLRKSFVDECNKFDIELSIPKLEYCIDNAAMIGFLGFNKFVNSNNFKSNLSIRANPNAIRK